MPDGHASFDSDIVCWSHLRWNFVYQRPQHVMQRLARDHRVFFVEEPIYGSPTQLEIRVSNDGVMVVVPHLDEKSDDDTQSAALARMFSELFADREIANPVAWYYSPMFLPCTRHLACCATVYDCMDELSAFAQAPPRLMQLEDELLSRADAVLTGGFTLYEAKCERHPNVHPFPSSVDVQHFARARTITDEPEDQAPIPRPRLGFFGVVDERMDLGLLADIAALRPSWHLVIVGPVVKIDPGTLPRRPNIHYLGQKEYEELPAYLAGWDVALLPFARNEATRFISPTKTPEYMAGGRPVVSTPIRDVVSPYGEQGLVRIAEDGPGFVEAIERALEEDGAARLAAHDAFLRHLSWDGTVSRMRHVVSAAVRGRRSSREGGPPRGEKRWGP